jgi:hypothetical protein
VAAGGYSDRLAVTDTVWDTVGGREMGVSCWQRKETTGAGMVESRRRRRRGGVVGGKVSTVALGSSGPMRP